MWRYFFVSFPGEHFTAGDVYCFLDPEVVARKESAVVACRRFNDADPADVEGQTRILRELFGSAGADRRRRRSSHMSRRAGLAS